MDEFYVRIQIDVPVYTRAQYKAKEDITERALQLLQAGDFLEELVDEDGNTRTFEDLPIGFQYGDMQGKLPGTNRLWEIVDYVPDGSPDDEHGYLYTVFYAGCEHGGDFQSYDEAIASIRPTEMGD